MSLKFNQRHMIQKNINALSANVHTKDLSEEYPCHNLRLCPICVRVCVGGHERDLNLWLPWLYTLFWLDLIVKSVVKKRDDKR